MELVVLHHNLNMSRIDNLIADENFPRCCNEKGNHELHCDSCLTWFHLKCAKMPKAVFKVLGDLGSSSAWFCDSCVADDARGPKVSLRRLEKTVSDIPIKFTEIINAALKDFKAEIKLELQSWVSEEIDKTYSLCNSRIQELEAKLTSLSNERQANIPQQLWSSVDRLERQARRGDIVFGGIPESIPQEDLVKLVIKSAEFYKLSCSTEDVARCIRLKRKGNVLVTFNTISKRDQLMKNYLVSKNLQLKDVHPAIQIASRIYLNDNISVLAQNLLMMGKELVKKKKIARVYIRRGGVFMVPVGGGVATQIWSTSEFPVS